MLKLDDRADLESLVRADVQESLTLDYKDARSLGKSNPQRNELCKDVSAFANSAGDQIVYGIEEMDRHPVQVQEADGVDSAVITREWIEQTLDSNIHPRIADLKIKPIDVAPGRAAYVITIPAATTNAPHMALDNKYYYRQNFQSVPMEDYQVRDTIRRATTPELHVRLSFPSGKEANIELMYKADISKPITLNAFASNQSAQPAFHTLVQLGIDDRLLVLKNGILTPVDRGIDPAGISQRWLERRISSPPELPLFKENTEFDLTRSSVLLGFPNALLTSIHRFRVTTVVQTPGYSATQHWTILQEGQHLKLLEP